MKIRLLFGGVCVVLLALLIHWAITGEPTLPSPVEPPPSSTANPAPIESAPAPVPLERAEVEAPPPEDPGAAAEEPFDPSPVKVTPWLARLLVVDEDEQPVSDAVITIWAYRGIPLDPRMAKLTGEKGNAYAGHLPTPPLELHTDATGCTQVTLEFESYVATASKQELGSTGEQYLWHARASEQETKFVIEVPITLHGIVLRADGLPAPQAKVTTRVNGSSSLQRGHAPEPEPVTTGADGRFEVPVQINAGYAVRAELDGARTFTERIWIRSVDPPEAVLAFPGAITISGLVVDASGAPLPRAAVSGWREYHLGDPEQDLDDYEQLNTKTDEHGRFSIPVRQHRRYQLIASADGHANSGTTWVETSPARPHVEVRLVLPSFATISGRVIHGDGSPFTGVMIGARPETGETVGASAVPNQRDLFPDVPPATSGEDGDFALLVHPGTTWTLQAFPVADNHRLQVTRAGIPPGRDDVLLRVTDDDLTGCVVRGTVVRTDGEPIGRYDVKILDYEDGKPRGSSGARIEIDGAHFTLPVLPFHGQYALRVATSDRALAPMQTEPFTTDQPELALEFRLEPWGEVPVRVLDAVGAPARRVRVLAARDVNLGFLPRPQSVDAEGRVLLKGCAPGPHHLRVLAGSEQVLEQELLVAPGLNAEIEVRLGKRSTGR